MKQLNKGFTLIELLVVIAIIGILAAVVLVSLSDSRQSAQESSAMQTMRQVRTSAEIFYNNNDGRYWVNGGGAGGVHICRDSEINRLIAAATSSIGILNSPRRCARDRDEYAIEIRFSPTRVYCVDDSGFSGEITVSTNGWTIGNVQGNTATACNPGTPLATNADCVCGL